MAGDPFTAYQEVARVMSAKKGSSSRTVSGDEVKITGSRRTTVEKLEPSSSLQGDKPKSGGMTTRCMQQSAVIARSAGSLATPLSNLNLKVFPQDCTVLPIGDPLEVIQVLQGGLLRGSLSHVHFLLYSYNLFEVCVLRRLFLSFTTLGSDCPPKVCRFFKRRSRT